MKRTTIVVFCCGYFTSPQLMAGIMREDIAAQDYRDFAENLGKYTPGEENITVFKTDGTLAGTLNYPMPDLGSLVSGGYATLFSPSYLASVQHNTGYTAVDFGNNAQYKTTYTLINRNEYSERDFHLPRLNKVVTEAALTPFVVGSELRENPDRYIWYARAGAGTQYQVDADTQQLIYLADAYRWKSGGTITHPTFENWRLRWYNYSPDNPNVQPLDSAAQAGDSGSPLFVYDSDEKIWKLAGVTTSIAGTPPYSMRTYSLFIQDEFIEQVMLANTDEDITDLSADGTISWGSTLTQGGNSWAWHGLEKALPGDATNEELDSSKDLRFNGEGGIIVLNQPVNHGAAKLQFSDNYQVKSAEGHNNSWVGGGIEVDSNKTLLWQVNGLASDVLHKIGAGTLHVNAIGVNGGALNVGDGTIILDQQADENDLKQAFSAVTLVSGRPLVVLADNDQVKPENIQFGYRGGTLDINGNSLSFSKINHNDKGAKIVNRNNEKTGVVTLYDNGFNFLGHIGEQNSGKLNLSYYASDNAYRATLSGGADVETLAVKRGELVLSGEQTIHAGNVFYRDDWQEQSYVVNAANISSGATLTVSDHAVVEGAVTVAADAKLNLYAHALLSGSVVLDEADSVLKAAITERESSLSALSSIVTADISGQGQLIKTGTGVLKVDGNITMVGDTELLAGTLLLNGIVTSTVNMASNTLLAGSGTLQKLNAASGATIYPGSLVAGTSEYATLRLNSLSTSGTVNLQLNSAFSRSATDKLLIEGDVNDGHPIMVSINHQGLWTDSDVNQNGAADNTEGVSVIQVGGYATKDSFQLADSYIARGAWAYGLYAFAPGKSAESEREVSGTGQQYWDYRLQNNLLSAGNNAEAVAQDLDELETSMSSAENVYTNTLITDAEDVSAVIFDTPAEDAITVIANTSAEDAITVITNTPAEDAITIITDTPAEDVTADIVDTSVKGASAGDRSAKDKPEMAHPQPGKPARRRVTPQVPGYISLPSTLFRAEEQRSLLFKERALDSEAENANIFLFGLSNKENYQSGNSFMQYGYNYKSRFNGWMLGATLVSWQKEHQSLSVSGAWSKGDLTYTPSAADGVSQGNFVVNALNLMAYWQNEDYYLNLLSGYGWTKGEITTALRGKVASPDVKQTFSEIEGGKRFSFGPHRVLPWVGYRLQRMHIKRFTDNDRAGVSYQQQRRKAWVAGIAYDFTLPIRTDTLHLGTAVQLTVRPSGQGKVTIGNRQQHDAFHTGSGGNSLNLKTEALLQLKNNLTLTTQIRHQRKLQQEGANDWLLAGGITFTF